MFPEISAAEKSGRQAGRQAGRQTKKEPCVTLFGWNIFLSCCPARFVIIGRGYFDGHRDWSDI